MLGSKMKKYFIGLLVSFSIGCLSYFSQLPNAYAGMFINMVTPNFAFSVGSGLNAYYTSSVPGYVYYYGYNRMYYMWYNGALMYAPYFSGPWAPVYRGMIIPRVFLSGPPAPPPRFRWGHWGPPPPAPPRDYYVHYWHYVQRPPMPPARPFHPNYEQNHFEHRDYYGHYAQRPPMTPARPFHPNYEQNHFEPPAGGPHPPHGPHPHP